MNQTCKVCGEPAAGFHFGAFTCEGCKSFFGRSYNNLSSISECKNNGKCVIDKKNRTTCKACRLRKCYTVGMSKGGSRYGRRSNWFKIHCLLQEQQQQAVEAAGKAAAAVAAAGGGGAAGAPPSAPSPFGDMAAAVAQQQLHQRNSHMAAAAAAAAQHIGYPSYLPDMTPPFMSAAALPFFSMMNTLPSAMAATASPPSAFQMPPHLLFPSYHPAAAAAAADAAYRSEMYKHRQSVDSAASAESQRFSPTAHSVHSTLSTGEELPPTLAASASATPQSPELCVSGDDGDGNEPPSAPLSHHSISPVSSLASSAALHQHQHHQLQQHQHPIHSPIAIRATPNATMAPLAASPVPPTEPAAAAGPASSPVPSFSATLQSLSPVSVCSTGRDEVASATATATASISASIPDCTAATSVANDSEAMQQDCPMDLSMKTSRSSVHSDSSDMQSDSSDEELRAAAAAMRRKFYQLNSEPESSDASSEASSEAVKRQKLADAQSYSSFAHSSTSLRGIFVCV